MTSAHLDPTALWTDVTKTLRSEMSQASFDQVIKPANLVAANGVYVIRAGDQYNLDWLSNRQRLPIARAIALHTGQKPSEIELEFILPGANYLNPVTDKSTEQPEDTDYLNPVTDNQHACSDYLNPVTDKYDPLANELGRMDYMKVYFKKGGLGYDQVAYYYSKYWSFVMGHNAYLLWLWLLSEDKRPLEPIAPNFWTPPITCTYEKLAGLMNRSNPRCLYGYPDECKISEIARRAGRPLVCECNKPWPRLWHKPARRAGVMCLHWNEGWLESLVRHGIARVELTGPGGRKPIIQTWRLLPLLTPQQVSNLSPELQQAHETELIHWTTKFDLDVAAWRELTVPSLLPYMPAYREYVTGNNFDQRRGWQEFLTNSHPAAADQAA